MTGPPGPRRRTASLRPRDRACRFRCAAGQGKDRVLGAKARAVRRRRRGDDALRRRDSGIGRIAANRREVARKGAGALPASHGQLVLGVLTFDVDATLPPTVGVLLAMPNDHDPGHGRSAGPPRGSALAPGGPRCPILPSDSSPLLGLCGTCPPSRPYPDFCLPGLQPRRASCQDRRPGSGGICRCCARLEWDWRR